MPNHAPAPPAPAPSAPSKANVVAVLAHPDDEVFCAGFILRSRAAGLATALVTLTRGEGGWIRNPAQLGDLDVAEIRSGELRRACKFLGASCFLMQAADGAVDGSDPELRDHLSSHLRTLAPQTIVTFAEDGVYGHRDHQACRQLTHAARRQAAPRAELLELRFPTALFAPLWKKLRRLPFIDRSIDGEQLGLSECATDLRYVLTPTETANKLRVISAHASQLLCGDPLSFLAREPLDWMLQREWYTRHKDC